MYNCQIINFFKNFFSMAKAEAYNRAVERAALEGRQTTFKKAKMFVRPLELNTIPLNTPFTIPSDYAVFEVPIRGTDNVTCKVITEEGWDFWPSCITRGAKSVSEDKFIRPTGQVVDDSQKYVDMDKFFKEKLAGKKLIFKDKTEVDAMYDGQPRKVNVFCIEYYEEPAAAEGGE
jgi:hypothetical protein